ncbi:tigger transposable element-derived protein 1 [Trichonephila clavipes]|nr:tigger transposable element-derived protein 1 [Trichonephila clavipes]
MDNDDVQELLDSHNQKLTIDVLIEIHELEQNIKELEYLDAVQPEDRMTAGNLTEGISLIEKKSLQILENTDSYEESIFFQQSKGHKNKLFVCYEEILWDIKNSFSRQTTR